MNARVVFGAALMLTLVAPLAPAHAACELSDLDGRWRAHMLTVNAAGRSLVQECQITANEDGEFQRTRCASIELDSDGLEVARNCQLTGAFILGLGGNELQCDVSATISISKEIISGRVACDPQPVFLLNMIKR
jgi:hypothetical protein